MRARVRLLTVIISLTLLAAAAPIVKAAVSGGPEHDKAVGAAPTPSGAGYWVAFASGAVYSYGDAPFHGAATNLPKSKPIVGMAASPSGGGYWLVAADGGVFAFGDAPFMGSTGALHLHAPIVGMAATPTGHGYWLAGADGGVFAFGDAPYLGSMVGAKLAKPVIGIAPSPSGRGYWLAAADGGVFAFGDSDFVGSTSGILSHPVVGIMPAANGHGYRLAASDGGVFAFGDGFLGSAANQALPAPITAIIRSDRGYRLITTDDSEYSFGSTPIQQPPSAKAPVATATATRPASGSVVDLITMHGDQVVTVPNGTYTAGPVSAAHPDTKGPFKGWLVLVAQTPGGVVVDQSPPGTPIGNGLTANGDLILKSDTSRVMFVGFKFVNGSVHVQGNNIGMWYTDHSFPAAVWANEPGHPSNQYHQAPRALYLDYGSSNIGIYGADLHDTGTALYIQSGVRNVTVSGIHITNLTDGGSKFDPNDIVHPDCIAMVGGDLNNVEITDSWMQPVNPGTIGIVPEDPYGPITNLNMTNLWISDVVSGGGINIASNVRSDFPRSGRGVFGTISNVRLWNNGWDRNEQIDGQNNTDVPNRNPNRINFPTTDYVTGPPPAGAVDPATSWRNAYHYSDWYVEV